MTLDGLFCHNDAQIEEENVAEDDTTPSLALESCREGLEEAREQGRRRQDRFEKGEVTLTVKTEVPRDTEVSGGECWCVFEADSLLSVHANRPQPGR